LSLAPDDNIFTDFVFMEKIAFAIYLAVLIISPLLFGAVHAYAYSLVFLLVLTASLLLVVHNIRKDNKTGSYYFQYPETGLNVLFYVVLAFLILQVLPLPSFLVGLLSPQALDVQTRAVELTGKNESLALAPYIYPVRMSLLRWTVYGLFFVGLSQVLNSRKRIEILCFCILVLASFISVYGIFQAYAGDHRIWWFSGYGQDVRGTYINRNHFAGLMAMALMLATAFASSLRGRNFQRNGSPSDDARSKILEFLSFEQIYSKRLLILFCGVIIGLGLVLSASRGGIISAALGLLILGIFYVSRKNQRRNGFIVLAIFLCIGGYGLQVGLEHTIERFQSDQLQSSFEGRFRYAQKTVDVFKDYEISGVGVGNFQHAYPRYQAPEDMGLLIDYAHNDWAQLLAEAGLAGLLLTVAGIGLFVFFIVRQWQGRRDPQALALGVVPLAVLTTMGVHSWFDFNMHIPANVLVLAAILAVGQASLAIRMRRSGENFELGFFRLDFNYKSVLKLVLLLLFIGWGMSWSVRHFAAESRCNTVPNSTFVREQNPSSDEIMKAISWDKYNAEYWYKLAQATRRERSGEEGSLDDVTGALEKAVLLNPFSAIYYLELGWTYTRKWQEPDFAEKWLPKSDQAMDLAALYSGARDPGLHRDVADYWLMRSQTLDPGSEPWEAALEKVGVHYQMALNLEKGKKREKLLNYIRKTVLDYYSGEDISGILGIKER
jgi:O-antigen ligase